MRLPNVANERKTVEGRVTLTDADFEPCTPKKTPRHFQSIADWGACRKTPVAAENHHLEAKKVAGLWLLPAAPAHRSYQLFAALSRTKPQTPLPATTTRDLISISEMMT